MGGEHVSEQDSLRDATFCCALCGYDTCGDFYVHIPGHPDAIMHSISCGPVLIGQRQVSLPTYERLADGTYRCLATAVDALTQPEE
jgi:hypothetical protein